MLGPQEPTLWGGGTGGGGAGPEDGLILPADGLCTTHLACGAERLSTTGIDEMEITFYLVC